MMFSIIVRLDLLDSTHCFWELDAGVRDVWRPHLFVAHELAEGQRRGRVCLFSGLGAQKATRPNKRSKQVGRDQRPEH